MSSETSDSRPMTIVLVLLGALVVLPLLFMGFGMAGFGMMSGSHMWGGGMWGGTGTMTGWAFLLAVVLRLLLVTALLGGGYLLYRGLTDDDGDAALEELRLAYARGDLSDEEFERRRERLQREE